MFAVPGWNVKAPLKTQTAPPPKSKSNGSQPANTTGEKQDSQPDQSTKNRPRKRTRDSSDVGGKSKGSKKIKSSDKVTTPSKYSKYAGKSKSNPQSTGVNTLPLPARKPEHDFATGKQGQNPEAHIDNPVAVEKKLKKKQKSQRKKAAIEALSASPSANHPPDNPPSALDNGNKLTPLQVSMRAKLAGARFRHLNELLYTTPSSHASKLFKDDPDMFRDYHTGFSQQVSSWPENPVDVFVKDIVARATLKPSWAPGGIGKKGQQPDGDNNAQNGDQAGGNLLSKPLPRNRAGYTTIADLGCGSASLASTLRSHPKSRIRKNVTVLSYDLDTSASNPLITHADIANLPLDRDTVDVAIFCLALMGTNWAAFIDEAYRVLRRGGECWIAEIKSRFQRKGPNTNNKPSKPESVAAAKSRPKSSFAKRQKFPTTTTPADNASDTDDNDGNTDPADANRILETEVDGVALPAWAGGSSSAAANAAATSRNQPSAAPTDITPFIAVMQRRGFTLLAEPEMGNRMFVLMRFGKGARPVVGRNVGGGGDDGVGRQWRGQQGPQRLKFIEKDEGENGGGDGVEGADEADGRVLKACVYKLR